MTEQDNVTVIHSSVAAFGRGDARGAAAPYADDAEYVELGTGQTYRGRAQIEAAFTGWLGAFPDAKGEVKNAVAAGDQVAIELTYQGTHSGPLPTPQGKIPATRKVVEVPAAAVFTLRDGKIRSHRLYFDMATLTRQLGLG